MLGPQSSDHTKCTDSIRSGGHFASCKVARIKAEVPYGVTPRGLEFLDTFFKVKGFLDDSGG